MFVVINKNNDIVKVENDLTEAFSIYNTVNDAVVSIWENFSKKEIEEMSLKVVELEEDSFNTMYNTVKNEVRKTYYYFRNILKFSLLFWKK